MRTNINNPFGNLTMERVISCIENETVFSLLKLCHGFWDLNVKFKYDAVAQGIVGEPTVEQWLNILEMNKVRWPVELFMELREFLNNAHEQPMLLISASEYGWKNGGEVEGEPMIALEETRQAIKEAVSDRVYIHDGLFWKNAVLDGSIAKFFDTIRKMPVLIVGPEYIKNFAKFARLSKSFYVEIDEKQAAWERNQILDKVREAHHELGGRRVVCLLEAGGATSAWIISKLFPELESSYMFSLGQVLNICNFSKLERVNWFMVNRKEICETINIINPDWSSNYEAYGDMDGKQTDKNIWFQKEIHTKGYDDKLFSIFINRKEIVKNTSDDTACSFIENKLVDYDLYHKILSISKAENHWANFGPVSRLLESSLKEKMQVNRDRSVVVCKSATDALHTLVGMYSFKMGRSLRWVVSAYGFFSTHIGPLADAIIIDCDKCGMLDLEKLKALDNDSWDAVMVTNIFGLCQDITPFIDYCEDQNKLFVMDNAMAFITDTRVHQNSPCEAVSFHHTKPWGIGEGGCAVVDSDDEELFRSLLNFGANIGDKARPFSTNGKLSDFDSALILQRLINMPDWERLYKLQARRINSIARKCGLLPLVKYPVTLAEYPVNIIGNLPFLAPDPVRKEALLNPWITLRKYYQPLNSEHNMANSIFSRIINIPCHPQVAKITDEQIVKAIDCAVNPD